MTALLCAQGSAWDGHIAVNRTHHDGHITSELVLLVPYVILNNFAAQYSATRCGGAFMRAWLYSIQGLEEY